MRPGRKCSDQSDVIRTEPVDHVQTEMKSDRDECKHKYISNWSQFWNKAYTQTLQKDNGIVVYIAICDFVPASCKHAANYYFRSALTSSRLM